MPLRAFINNEEVFAAFISELDWKIFKGSNPNIILPCCNNQGFLRVSKLGIKHFVHKKAECDWKPESWQHLLAKTEIVKACIRSGYAAKTEVAGSNWRADTLATKQSSKGLVQIVIEVQWSPQTLQETQERQAKYERDGVRCCWLFRKLPTDKVSRELPMFKLSFEENKPIVETDYGNLPLGVFIENLLKGQFKFCAVYRLADKQKVKLVFFPITCWKCKKKHHIYYVENPYASICGTPVYYPNDSLTNEVELCLRPEIIKAAYDFSQTEQGKNIKMGKIKSRYSKTVNESYLSFGCPWCNALLGNYFYYFETCDNYGNKNNIVHEVELDTASDSMGYAPHWCYSPSRTFCT